MRQASIHIKNRTYRIPVHAVVYLDGKKTMKRETKLQNDLPFFKAVVFFCVMFMWPIWLLAALRIVDAVLGSHILVK
jgi:hypothetical protein